MNGRCRSIVLGVVMSLLTGPVFVAELDAATLPQEVRTTTNSQSARAPIQAFIESQVPKLGDKDPKSQQQARDALVGEVQAGAPGQPQPSGLFLDVYADVLNEALKPLAAHEDPRVRLNVAIAAARVAQGANNSRLAPLIIDLLDDPCEPVVLWAVKASKFIIPQILGNTVARQNDQLLPAFMKAVGTHIRSGPLVQSAYESLRLEFSGPNAVAPATLNDVVPIVVDAIHDLLDLRLAIYKNAIPALPAVETTATAFIVDGRVWRIESKQAKAQRMRTVQLICDLMSVAAGRWPNADPLRRAELAELVKKAAAGAWVVGDNIGNANIKRAAEGVNASPTTPPEDVADRVNALRDAIKAAPDFAALKPAPVLGPLAATQPATQAATTRAATKPAAKATAAP